MSSIQEYYKDRYAGDEHGAGHEAEPTFRLRVEKTLAAIGGGGPRRILDFGCNIGGAVRLFAEAGHEVAGVDISDSAIRIARQRLPDARFELLTAENRVPFSDHSFDVCYSSEVIEHLFDVTGFLREMHRVLTPEGLLVLTTPYHGWIKNLLVMTFNFEKHFDPTGGHVRFFSKQSLTHCLRASGFRVEHVSGIGRRRPVWKSMFVTARRCA
jgi:SAM-dependent methyltransferase